MKVMITPFKSALIATIFLAGNVQAQMDSCNVFLQGNHVEVGISPSGSYGSSVPAPSGYHANMNYGGNTYRPCGSDSGGNYLGFVADPERDGWTVGTPAYMGDYFLPGTPFEGWSIQVGGVQYQAYNTTGTAGFTGSLTGSNISYTPTVGNVSSVWQGYVDSIQITQTTSLDTGALFFTMEVTFTNLSSSPIDNIYYLRSVDPDNDELWPGGSFVTTNVIAHQVPDTTVVTATGPTVAWSMMALGTTDTNARTFIYESWPISATLDLSTVYNETYTTNAWYAQGYSNVADDAIGIVYSIPHLSGVDSAADSVYRTTSAYRHPANSTTIKYFYAFSQPGLDSALSAMNATSTLVSTGVKNINNNGEIKVYPNPARGIVNITNLSTGDQLTLIDMMGRTVMSQAVVSQGNNTLSVNAVAAGAYILAVQDANGNLKSKSPLQIQ